MRMRCSPGSRRIPVPGFLRLPGAHPRVLNLYIEKIPTGQEENTVKKCSCFVSLFVGPLWPGGGGACVVKTAFPVIQLLSHSSHVLHFHTSQ